MGTRKGGYFTRDGTRVPSVTTVLGRFKESGGLIHWAWDLGRQGLDYREVRDQAASAGTLAHEMVEAWIRGQDYEVPNGVDRDTSMAALNAFENFLRWAEQSRLRVTESEVPLVSERYGFGGTFDAILIGGARHMGDWKTSNAIYPEYLVQLAAYGLLWEENNPNDPISGGYDLLRFDKTHGDFTHKHWSELDVGKRQFLLLLEAYKCDKELRARAK